MTVLTNNSRETKLGNGVTTVFNFSVVFIANSDLVVIKVPASGSPVQWTLGVQYTLTGAGSPTGGTLTTTLGNTLATGDQLIIDRQIAATQLVDLSPNGPLPADTLEGSLDKLTMLVQERYRVDQRSLRMDTFDPATGIDPLPYKADLANRMLTFDADGNPQASSFLTAAVAAVIATAFSGGSVPLLEVSAVGDGSTTTFAVGANVPSPNSAFVFVDGILQPTNTYSTSGTDITFFEAPPLYSDVTIRLASSSTTGGAFNGGYPFGGELTIASGVISVAGYNYYSVDTQSDAASDDLDTINGGSFDGQLLILKAADSARTVVVKDATGNLRLAGDFSLTHIDDRITLLFDGSNWCELSRSDNTA